MKRNGEKQNHWLWTLALFLIAAFLLTPHSWAQTARYVDNGNGTVTDTMTGLIWQQVNDGIARNIPGSRAYCESLVLGDSADWRLPRIDEISTLVDYTRYRPSLDPIFSHIDPLGIWGYWSDTVTQYTPEYYYGSGVLDGGVGWTYPGVEMMVRCVRGGPFWTLETSDRLEPYGEEIVRDIFNFKMWQKFDGGTHTWEDAGQYCNQASTGDYTDWRLPGTSELQTILDYTRILPCIGTMFSVSNSRGGGYWSADLYLNEPGYAWAPGFTYGTIGGRLLTDLLYVRCVRDDPPHAFTVAISPSGAGSVTKSPDKPNYFYGDVVTLTASGNPGYMFKNWTRDGINYPDRKTSKNNSMQITIEGDLSLTANFTKTSKKK